MFNPNTNEQMMVSVASDLAFLGLIVADVKETPRYCSFTVGNQSMTFCVVTFTNGHCKVFYGTKSHTVSYKGSLEQLGEDVAAKVVKAAFVVLNHCNS